MYRVILRKRSKPTIPWPPTFFGQRQKPSKMFRVGLYARVSTNDQQTLPIQSRALRDCTARRGWTITVQIGWIARPVRDGLGGYRRAHTHR
jgi:hypothetical protein